VGSTAKQLELIRPDSASRRVPIAPFQHAPLRVAGLFAGIGGVELGLSKAGHTAALFSEIDDHATMVLRHHFPHTPIVPDVRDVDKLPPVDVLAAGFPCQDLSQAGKTAGISGQKSGLVAEVFRLLSEHDPQWLILENVPFMLSLDGGRGMLYLTTRLERLGFGWAYRVVDTRSFGLPQRRQRVILLASRSQDPRNVLYADEAAEPDRQSRVSAYGFYWTEGNRGLGWAVDAVPTLKAGSTVGIPSPPAVWVLETGEIGTPDIRDAERLQGFPAAWTAIAANGRGLRSGPRWRLVGNAVSVRLTEWLGRRLRSPGCYDPTNDAVSKTNEPWPRAAWSMGGAIRQAHVSEWPLATELPRLMDFLEYPLKPLSARATAGFYKRASNSTLRFADGFLPAVQQHLRRMQSISFTTNPVVHSGR